MNLKHKIPSTCEIFFIKILQQQILILKNNNTAYYFKIPPYIYCTKDTVSHIITFNCFLPINSADLLKKFNIAFSTFLRQVDKPLIKKLILKGLGLKASLSENGTRLDLKLGFSHMIRILVPTYLSVTLNKSVVSVRGSNLVDLGVWCSKIRALKRPNVYKGKGVWYKNEILKLKTIKKA